MLSHRYLVSVRRKLPGRLDMNMAWKHSLHTRPACTPRTPSTLYVFRTVSQTELKALGRDVLSSPSSCSLVLATSIGFVMLQGDLQH